jgi:DNA-binding XRE family transcriptional regulator
MTVTLITLPGGEELAILPRAEYEALRDAADAAVHARAMASLAAGGDALTADEVLEALEAPTPLAFWRKRRSVTQAALAKAAGISQSYLAQIEAGDRKGDPAHFLRLAKALGVRMEDLVAE